MYKSVIYTYLYDWFIFANIDIFSELAKKFLPIALKGKKKGSARALPGRVVLIVFGGYLASRPARMALMLVSTTASPLRPKMDLMAFSSSSKGSSR